MVFISDYLFGPPPTLGVDEVPIQDAVDGEQPTAPTDREGKASQVRDEGHSLEDKQALEAKEASEENMKVDEDNVASVDDGEEYNLRKRKVTSYTGLRVRRSYYVETLLPN